MVEFTVAQATHYELIVKKSRFLACVQPIADRQRAQEVVAHLRVRHPEAAHVCWAMLARGQAAAVDDGEPAGTAGKPMLAVLRHQHLDGVLATVVRYFGGIKLGAGGLVRAYTDSVAQALLCAKKVPRIAESSMQAVVDYALEGPLRRELPQFTAEITGARHAERVTLCWRLPSAQVEACRQRFDHLCQGRIQWLDASGDA